MITFEQNHFRIEHFFDASECLDLVRNSVTEYLDSVSDKPSHVNYNFTQNSKNEPHTLEYLFLNNQFDLGYSIVYYQNTPTAFGGIRLLDSETIVVASRGFCFHTKLPILSKVLVPFHLSIGKQKKIKTAKATFNDYNKRIYDLWPTISNMKNLIDYSELGVEPDNFKQSGVQNVNYTNQYVIEWDLQ